MTTFVGAMFFGVLFIVISHKLRVSAIVLLLLGGVALGKHGLGLLHPEHLGDGLRVIVSLAVGLILFEGGLTLDMKGYREAPKEIRSLMTKGVLITWAASSLIVWLLFDYPLEFCMLAGSLVIVTGPTVIGPLLKRIQVSRKVHSILHWEGVLIDPAGVFITLLCYEWLTSGGHLAITEFMVRVLVGVIMGLTCGGVIAYVIKRNWIPKEHLNIFVVVAAVGIFALSDLFAHESGLLTVTIAGFVIGYIDRPQVQQIKRYKAELIELLIGMLFMLLAANLDVPAFLKAGWKGFLAVVIVMFLVRPLNIFVSLHNKTVTFREKLFLSWVAPRGIVAASMASLFALLLSNQQSGSHTNYSEYSWFLETFTYSVIAGTVIFQGFSAGWVAKLLGLRQPEATGWLVIGAHRLGRMGASFIQQRGYSVVMLDTNVHNCAVARRAGHTVISGNALTIDPDDYPALYGIGNVLAITANEDLNTLACQRWDKELANGHLYKWVSSEQKQEVDTPELMVGRPIWEDLRIGQMRTIDLDDDKVEISADKVRVGDIRHRERVLLSAFNETLTPGLPKEANGTGWVLMYRPFRIQLDVEIQPDWIVLSTAESMKAVTRELLDLTQDFFPELDSDRLHNQLMQQEEQYSSLIGYEVALPHAYTEVIDKSIVLIAKMAEPITCMHSTEEIRYVFLVLSPKDKPRHHLNALSEISTFIMNEENRRHLNDATSPHDLVHLFFPDMDDEAPSSGDD